PGGLGEANDRARAGGVRRQSVERCARARSWTHHALPQTAQIRVQVLMIAIPKRLDGFRLRVCLQLVVLVAAVFLLCYATLVVSLFVTATLALALIVSCVFSLFRMVEQTERNFARFL